MSLAGKGAVVTGGGTVNIVQGTVSGNGTVGGDVTNAGGTISPGNSPGVFRPSRPNPPARISVRRESLC